jgi:hypothetical protein
MGEREGRVAFTWGFPGGRGCEEEGGFFSPLSGTAASRFDALRLLKALSLSMGTSPVRLGGPSTRVTAFLDEEAGRLFHVVVSTRSPAHPLTHSPVHPFICLLQAVEDESGEDPEEEDRHG